MYDFESQERRLPTQGFSSVCEYPESSLFSMRKTKMVIVWQAEIGNCHHHRNRSMDKIRGGNRIWKENFESVR